MSERPLPKVGNNTRIYHPELSNIHATATIGAECRIHSHVWIGECVIIGDRCRIQAFTFIPMGVYIHDDVFIGPHVVFTNDKVPPSYGKEWKPISVKSGASIGAGAVILPGVVIGENATVAAGAVVSKDVPPNTIAIGVPARHEPYKRPVFVDGREDMDAI